jgi:protocatechuate 3,4-dioxygenase beta subunit
VVGAWVRVQETGQTDVTDADGHFRFAALVPGAYTLAARAVGFHDANPLSITVPPQPHNNYDIQMTPL